jgi:hypothetical protein
LLTVADKVKFTVDKGLLLLTVGEPTTKSHPGRTVTSTNDEQSFVLSDWPGSAFTQA